MKKRLVVGLTGASGAPLSLALLRAMQSFADWETHVVYSDSFLRTLETETDCSPEQLKELCSFVYDLHDMAASVSSGTFRTEGMIIVPCSMKTVAGIACGYSDNLILRAADVTLKERRKLVLLAREAPLSGIHLRNMLTLSQMGASILPPMLTYYNNPETVEDMTRHIVGKALSAFDLELPGFQRWK